MNPFAPCHTITVDTGAFSTDGSASILDAALAQGAQVPFSCQRGECGSCRATVLEGRYERIAPANERSYVTADDELLMCQCRAAGDLRLTFPHWQAPARPPEPRRARVVSRLPLAPGVTQLIVEMEDARPYAWLPGQHVQLLLEDGVRRNFSIANVPVAATPDSLASVATASVATTASPAASSATMSGGSAPNVVERDASGPVRLEFHIRRMPGGVFTDGILPRLAPGDTLTLEGPLGACVWPGDGWRNGAPGSLPDGLPHGSSNGSHNGADHLVLLATGTGFAGVFPILMAALHDRRMASVTLYWGGRTPDDCYAAPLLNALQGKHAGLRWHAALSDTTREHAVELDGGGARTRSSASAPPRVQDLALAGGHDWTRSVVYACGNPTMVREARARLVEAGLPPARFLSEAFLPATAGAAIDAPPRHEHAWERVGRRFTMAGILDARQRSLDAVRDIAALIRPGMTTRDAVNAADAHLRGMGASHNWHPTYVRFGVDTQSPAVQPTDFQRVLRDDDTFVVDIGPVWDGYEGDYGDTFVTGRDDAGARCARAAREVFRRTRLDWLAGATGEALYDRADAYAREYGCALVREIPGHRVSDFPHALYGKHKLAHADFAPADGIWVLEIQVRDLTLPVGAFYEDVLLREA